MSRIGTPRSRRVRRGVPRRTRGSSRAAGTGSRNPRVLGDDQRAGDQPLGQLEHLARVDRTARAHGFGRVECPAAANTVTPRQQPPLGLRSTGRRTSRSRPGTSGAVRPSRRLPPASSWNRRSRRAAQLRGFIAGDPRRGQLDRQRHPIEAPAHLHRPRSAFSAVTRSPASSAARPLHEQAHRLRCRDPSRGRRIGAATPSDGTARIRSPSMPRPSRLVASTLHPRARLARSVSTSSATASRRCSQLSSTNSNCLCRKKLDQRLLERPTRPRRSPRTPPRPRRRTPSGSRTGASSHQPRPVRELAAAPPPRPATPNGSCRPHPRPSASPPAPRERLRDPRPISRRGRRTSSPAAAGCPGTRPASATAGTRAPGPARSTWNTRSGRAQIAQAVLTQVDQLDGPRRRTQLARRHRHHDLAAVRHSHQPGSTVHRTAVVVAVAQLRLAGVHPHPHPQRPRLPERLRRQPDAAPRPPRPTRRARSRTRRGRRRPSS